MIIGFSNGDYHRMFSHENDRYSKEFINHYQVGGANAIELHCLNVSMLDYLLSEDIDLSYFSHISLHTPSDNYANNKTSKNYFSKFELLHKKYRINNFIFHPNLTLDWTIFGYYKHLPLSIENLDDRNNETKTVKDIKKILDKNDLNLTLDLQHCFLNDKSMKLAQEFHEEFGDRIVEYHLSGFDSEFIHYPLFKTSQNIIIESVQKNSIPIIIESEFHKIGEAEKEMDYIKSRLDLSGN